MAGGRTLCLGFPDHRAAAEVGRSEGLQPVLETVQRLLDESCHGARVVAARYDEVADPTRRPFSWLRSAPSASTHPMGSCRWRPGPIRSAGMTPDRPWRIRGPLVAGEISWGDPVAVRQSRCSRTVVSGGSSPSVLTGPEVPRVRGADHLIPMKTLTVPELSPRRAFWAVPKRPEQKAALRRTRRPMRLAPAVGRKVFPALRQGPAATGGCGGALVGDGVSAARRLRSPRVSVGRRGRRPRSRGRPGTGWRLLRC